MFEFVAGFSIGLGIGAVILFCIKRAINSYNFMPW